MLKQDILASKTLDMDTHELLMDNNSFFYLLNGDISGYENSNNNSFVQNVLSNEECYKIPTGFTFNGSIQLRNDRLAIYLSNDMVGRIDLLDANSCVSKNLFEEECLKSLEDIKGVSQIIEGEEHIYWISKCKPLRSLNIEKCFPKEKNCEECEETNVSDCNALNVNSSDLFPCIDITEGSGNIPNGVYQIAIAFSDKGSRLSDYYIYPEVIKLFDDKGGNFSINVEFTDCIDEYELVLITHRSDRSTVALSMGNFTGKNVLIDTIDETFQLPIDLETLYATKTYYQGADYLAVNAESLILGGLQSKPKFDYRLQACDIEVEWVEMKVKKEDAHLYPSLMRDEVYPIWIGFEEIDGQESHLTHIPNSFYGENTNGIVNTIFDDAPSNKDHPELDGEGCEIIPRKYWEIYNTATVTNNTNNICGSCDPVEGKSGRMSYWESSNHTYSDNHPCEDLRCLPIRYHKMPDNCVSHIHDGNTMCNGDACEDTCINILTLRLKNVTPPIDCCGKELPIKGYRIHVGDRKNHKSVLHKGLLFNTGNDPIDCQRGNSLYSNYPFNDLQPDKFLGTDLVRQGNVFEAGQDAYDPLDSFNQDKFTYHSPDIHYIKGSKGTELKLYTEQIGRVSGYFHETEDYPKYQILSPLGQFVSSLVGVIEATIALNGEKCTKTITEKVCERMKEKVTEVTGFPVAEISSTAAGYTIIGTATGTAVVNPMTGPLTSLSTTVNEHDYTETVLGDRLCCCEDNADPNDCEDCYEVTDDPEITTSIGSTLTDLFAGNECRVTFPTDAPDGTVVSIQIDDQVYSAVVSMGQVQMDIREEDCDPVLFNQLDLWKFEPSCPCTGNETTTSTIETEECETRIDLIDDLSTFEKIPTLLYYYSQGVEAVETFLKSIITPTNYAVQYTAKAEYDAYNCESVIPGNCRRLINTSQYLLPIRQNIDGNLINNWSRESSEFIELNSTINNPCEKDNSRVLFSDMFCDTGGNTLEECNKCTGYFPECSLDNEGERVQAVSYYAGVKLYKPNQYGGLNDHLTRTVSCTLSLDNTDSVFAGDIYISKFSMKRKMPFWTNLPLGLPNNTEFDLRPYSNVGIPRFWIDVNKEGILANALEILPIIGGLARDYNLENVSSLCECGTSIDLPINLFGETLADILSALNSGSPIADIIDWLADAVSGNFRNPFKLTGLFYTHVTGITCFWAESEFISDFRESNELEASEFYPKQDITNLAKSTNYNQPELFNYNLHYLHQGVSRQYLKEGNCCDNNLLSNSLIYSVKQNEDSATNSWLNFPALNIQTFSEKDGKLTGIVEIDDYNLFLAFEDAVYITQQDEGLITNNGNTLFIGSPNVFSRRLKRIATDCTGYTGCIDPKSIIPTRYGVFWFDRKRKKVFNYSNNLKDVTGKLQSFFQEYLNSEVIGIYDNFTDNLYFTSKDSKWTLSYKPKAQGWVSFHSFLPNDYLCMSNNFLSIKDGIWKHNKKYDYGKYYGIKYPFKVGSIVKDWKVNVLQSLEVYAEFINYLGYDCKEYKEDFFDHLIIYNNQGGMSKELRIKNPENVLDNFTEYTEVSNMEGCSFRINDLTNEHLKTPVACRECPMDIEIKEGVVKGESKDLRGKWFKTIFTKTVQDTKIITLLNLSSHDEIAQ